MPDPGTVADREVADAVAGSSWEDCRRTWSTRCGGGRAHRVSPRGARSIGWVRIRGRRDFRSRAAPRPQQPRPKARAGRSCTRCLSTWTLELREGALPGRRTLATGRHQRARMSKSKIRYTEAISRGHSARAAEDSINPPDRLRGSITAMTAALGGGRRLLAGEIELAEVVSPPGMPACRVRPMRQ
jgi:hypothetical protein